MTSFTRRSMTGGLMGLFAAVSAGKLFGQRPGGPPRGNPQEMLDRQMVELKDRLKLSREQEPKVRGILETEMKKSVELRRKFMQSESGQRPPREGMEAMAKIRQESREELAKVLDEKQLKEYDKLQQERRERFGAGRGPGGAGGGRRRQQ